MTGFPMEVGRVVRSRAGRDEVRCMMVLELEDEQYVRVADGDLRKLEKPKRKKIRHLHATPALLLEVAEKLSGGRPVENADIRKALAAAGYWNRGDESGEEG